MENLYSRKTIINESRILITLIIACCFSLIILKLHLFSIGVVLALFFTFAILLNPKYYILFWLMIAAISNKVVIPEYDVTSYGVMNLLFLPVLTFKIFYDYRKEFFQYPVWKQYSLFLLLLFISIWYSPEPYLMGIRKYCNFIIPLLFSVLFIGTIKDYSLLKRYLKLMLIAVAIMGIVGTIMYYSGKWVVNDMGSILRAEGVLGQPNSYALFLNMNLAIALSLAIFVKNKKEKILYYILSLIIIFSLIPTFSKAGYIGLLLVLLLVTFLTCLKRNTFTPLILFLFLLILIGSIIFIKYQYTVSYRLVHNESFDCRTIIWKSTIHKFFEHPFIGNGFRSSMDMVRYLGPYRELFSTHNLFLQILLEMGIIGLIAFFIAYFSMLKYVIKVFFQTKHQYTNALAIGFIAFFISAFVHSYSGDSFLTPMVNLYVWFYFSFLICFYRLEKS